MSAAVGSGLWLLKHELRMFYFNLSSGQGQRGVSKRVMLWIAILAIGFHVFAYFVMRGVSAMGAGGGIVLPLVGVVMAATFTMMLSSGLKSSVDALFERGDFDLLLASPLASRTIFVTRLAAIVLSIAGIYLLILTPFAHAALLFGDVRWLAIYPAVFSMATMAAAVAMAWTLWLVRLLGARKTRVVAQVIGAFSGAFFFLVSQLFANGGSAMQARGRALMAGMFAPGAMLGPDSVLWLPARGALGEALPLAGMVLVALALFALTARLTHRFFVHGVQQAASTSRVAPRPADIVMHFGRGLFHTVVVKEWRLIARDPQLISQVFLQLLYMLPMCVLVFSEDGAMSPRIAAALAFLCSSLTGAFTWIIVSAEDAPDLLRSAPCSQAIIRRAKLFAASAPALALVAAPLAWMVAREAVSGLLTAAIVVAAVAWSALIVSWCSKPVARGDFRRRGKTNVASTTLETLSALAFAGLAFLLLSGTVDGARSAPMIAGACAIAGVAVALLAIAWMVGRRQL